MSRGREVGAQTGNKEANKSTTMAGVSDLVRHGKEEQSWAGAGRGDSEPDSEIQGQQRRSRRCRRGGRGHVE
ncbi:hypothetical protein FQN51_004436, partial [Onygenales sp. PD_10]